MRIHKRSFLGCCAVLSVLGLYGCPSNNSPSSPNNTATPTHTFTATNTVCTDGSGHTCTPTLTGTPTNTSTNTSTGTPTPTATTTYTQSPTGTSTNSPTITPTFAATPLPYKTQISTGTWYPSSLSVSSSGTTLFVGLSNGSNTFFAETLTSSGVSLASYASGSFYQLVAAGPLNGNVYTEMPLTEYTPLGSAVTSWSTYGTTSFGTGGVATAPNGNVYIDDIGHNQIDEFTSSGSPVTTWTDGNLFLVGGGQSGAIAVSPMSPYNVYAFTNPSGTDYFVQEYSANGSPVTQWGGSGSGFGKFNNPQAIAVGPNGNVYVYDTWNHLIQEFDASGNFLSQWGSPSGIVGVGGIAVAPNGDVYAGGIYNITVYGP